MVTTCMLSLYLPITVIIFILINSFNSNSTFQFNSTIKLFWLVIDWMWVELSCFPFAACSGHNPLSFNNSMKWRAPRSFLHFIGVVEELTALPQAAWRPVQFIPIQCASFISCWNERAAPVELNEFHSLSLLVGLFGLVLFLWRSRAAGSRP